MTKLLIEKCHRLIDEMGPCCSMSQNFPDRYKFFKKLLSYHPDNKAGNIVELQILISQWNDHQLKFVNDEGHSDTISWVECVKEMARKSRKKRKIQKETTLQNISKAMRNAVYNDQILAFKLTFERKFTCALCDTQGTKSRDFEVDHELEFHTLRDDFLVMYPRYPTEFVKIHGNRAFTENDKAFEEAWKEYHQQNAKLRILCKECNQARNKKDQ